MASSSPFEEFKYFLGELGALTATGLALAGASYLVDLTSKLGPPWPEAGGVTLTVALVNLATMSVAFIAFRRATYERLNRALLEGVGVFAVALACYLLWFSFFVQYIPAIGRHE